MFLLLLTIFLLGHVISQYSEPVARMDKLIEEYVRRDCASIVIAFLTPLPPLPFLQELEVSTRHVAETLADHHYPSYCKTRFVRYAHGQLGPVHKLQWCWWLTTAPRRSHCERPVLIQC